MNEQGLFQTSCYCRENKQQQQQKQIKNVNNVESCRKFQLLSEPGCRRTRCETWLTLRKIGGVKRTVETSSFFPQRFIDCLMHWLYKVDQTFEFETKTSSLVSVTTSKWNFQKVYFFPSPVQHFAKRIL